MVHLHDPKLKVIGLVGPAGVGKTNVLRLLNNQIIDTMWLPGETRLDFILVITLPKELDKKEKIIETIQDRVLKKLKQAVPDNADEREFELSKFLGDKSFILLIDQICTDIDLNKLGLPNNDRWKVVLASHSQKVINEMASTIVEMEPLSIDHAINLFQNIYGKINDENLELKAHGILKCCGGLPQVIKLVAVHLKDKRSSWDGVKRILQNDTDAKFLGAPDVCNAYKMVYDKLHEEMSAGWNIKRCLLYGLLFPLEHLIHKDYLTECWMSEGFNDLEEDVDQRLQESRGLGDTLLKTLTDNYLLLWCSDGHVKMPIYFRKLAFKEEYMAKENCLILKASQRGMPDNANSDSTLLQERNTKWVTLEDSLFEHMGVGLRVLDLNKTTIKSLPNPVTKFTKLVSLYLNDCSQLTGLPNEVENLKALELLDVRGTSLQSLPDEIGLLVGLRCLRVSFACGSKVTQEMIPGGIIDKLKKLEEFSVETCISNKRWNSIADRVAGELASLEKLNTLNFRFPTISSLTTFVTERQSWQNRNTLEPRYTFRSFNFFVGSHGLRHPYDSDISETGKKLRFCTGEENCSDNDFESIKDVLKQAEAFVLFGHVGVQSLNEFGLENVRSLKVLIAGRCHNLKTIFREELDVVFKSLKKLQLFNLNSLQCIWRGSAPIPQGCLSKLEVLTLCGCPELKEILNLELAKALSSLKHLKVENCAQLVTIVSSNMHEPDDHQSNDALQKLETLELKNLPKLQSICTGTSPNSGSSLRIIHIERCGELRDLSMILNSAKKVEKIMCESHWWEKLVLGDENKEHFRSRGIVVTLQPLSVVAGGAESSSSGSGRSVNHFEESSCVSCACGEK
ncbi:hypothetical protein ABFX02_07G084400 [Erythranthe guttata]